MDLTTKYQKKIAERRMAVKARFDAIKAEQPLASTHRIASAVAEEFELTAEGVKKIINRLNTTAS